jgi:hypothetical protein
VDHHTTPLHERINHHFIESKLLTRYVVFLYIKFLNYVTLWSGVMVK